MSASSLRRSASDSNLGLTAGLTPSGRSRSDSDSRAESQNMTTPSGKVSVKVKGTLGSHTGNDVLSMEAVKARISVFGTNKDVPIVFEVSLFRKDVEGNNRTLPGVEKLLKNIEAVFDRMKPEDIDKMEAFRINFARTRKDGAEEMPTYEFKNFSTRSVGQADFNDHKVKGNKKLGEELGTLCGQLTNVHNTHINAISDETSADASSSSASSKKATKPKARTQVPTETDARTQRHEHKGDRKGEADEGKRQQGSHSVRESMRRSQDEAEAQEQEIEKQRAAALRAAHGID